MSPFSPSPQQSTIFSHLRDPHGPNLSVSAVAGSGKTTTIVEGLRTLPILDSFLPPAILFLAFNKSIAETLATRCPRGVNCSTFHSLGFRALKNSGHVKPNVRVDSRKTMRLIYNALGNENPDVIPVSRLVSLAKTVVPCRQDTDFWEGLIRQHDLSFDESNKAILVASRVLHDSCADLSCIDFDDMLYLPVLLSSRFDPQDWVFVDEAQDTNDIQAEILSRLAAPEGMGRRATRYCFVGDPYQAIYGFRGANSDAMTKLARRFSCVSLPLSVSYRCPQAIVAEARRALTGFNTEDAE